MPGLTREQKKRRMQIKHFEDALAAMADMFEPLIYLDEKYLHFYNAAAKLRYNMRKELRHLKREEEDELRSVPDIQ